nr:hypothetical protein [Bradyrhizobium liaoningense]
MKGTRDGCEAIACDQAVDRVAAWARSIEKLATERHASRNRLLHCANDRLTIRDVTLTLEQSQATADHGKEVVNVVDDELRHAAGRSLCLCAASERHAARAGTWGGPKQDPGDLAIAPNERNLYVPRRDDTGAAIADIPTTRARQARQPKCDTGAIRKHDYILWQKALDLMGNENVG